MNCPHCERLRISVDMQADEIRRLKRELGYRRKAAETGSVMAALEIPLMVQEPANSARQPTPGQPVKIVAAG